MTKERNVKSEDETAMGYLTIYIVVRLKELALKRGDDEMIRFLDNYERTNGDFLGKYYYDYTFLVIPSMKRAKESLKYGIFNKYDITLSILSSVAGTSPYSDKISYEEYIKIMRYIIKKSGIDCEKFLKDIGKEVKTERIKRIIVATMLRLCGISSNISQLASKSLRIGHIPQGYYH